MPELPEVEQYRQILLPLVPSKAEGKKKEPIAVALTTPSGSKPPKKWLTPEDVETLSPTKNGCENVAVAGGGGGYFCCDVKRRGKLICLVLRSIAAATAAEKEGESNTTTAATDKYLFLHFGMTGRISSPDRIIRLESVKDDDDGSGEDTAAAVAFPPPHCHMTISAGSYKTAFTDRRKFGSAQLLDDASPFDDLAPDALSSLSSASSSSSPASSNAGEGTEASIAASAEKDGGADAVESIVAKMAGQSTGIKAMLLDQKRLLSGVGNWVADEVLYQCFIHPDQAYLTSEEARNLLEKLGSILAEAVERLKQGKEFPDSWLFGYRWTKKKSGSKDSQGRPLTFVVSCAFFFLSASLLFYCIP